MTQDGQLQQSEIGPRTVGAQEKMRRSSDIPFGIFHMEYSIANNQLVKWKIVRQLRRKLDLKAIGSRIRELRGDLPQEELAAILRISQGQLSKIERGSVAPTLQALLGISDKFGKTLDWIVTGR
jgi:DNA-binding XRE family transcriptional regulator